MLKALVNPGAYTSGNIPFTIYQNTNDKYALDTTDNTFDVKVAGLTEVKGNVIATATAAGVLSLQAYANGSAISGAVASATVAIGDTVTLNINDIIKTVYQANPVWANVSLQLSGACTLVGGDFILSYQR